MSLEQLRAIARETPVGAAALVPQEVILGALVEADRLEAAVDTQQGRVAALRGDLGNLRQIVLRRVLLGLSRRQVAERAGISRATLRSVENGHGRPEDTAAVRAVLEEEEAR